MFASSVNGRVIWIGMGFCLFVNSLDERVVNENGIIERMEIGKKKLRLQNNFAFDWNFRNLLLCILVQDLFLFKIKDLIALLEILIPR